MHEDWIQIGDGPRVMRQHRRLNRGSQRSISVCACLAEMETVRAVAGRVPGCDHSVVGILQYDMVAGKQVWGRLMMQRN